MALFGCGPAAPDESQADAQQRLVLLRLRERAGSSCSNPLNLDTRPLPSAIAFGARFELSYTPKSPGSTFPNVTVQAVSGDFFSVEQNVLVPLRAGTPWFIALAYNNSVLDLTSLTIEPVARILVGEAPSSLNPNITGSTHTFVASAQGALGQSLAGDIPCTWTSSDPAVIAIQTSGVPSPSSSVTVVLMGPGTATLTAATSTAIGTGTVSVDEGLSL
jgi:hypothetical protein